MSQRGANEPVERLERARLDPASVFRDPEAVLRDESLSRDEKFEILSAWEYDLAERAVAREEDARGEDAGWDPVPMLERVAHCLLEITAAGPRARTRTERR